MRFWKGQLDKLTKFGLCVFEFGFEEAEFLESGVDFLGAVVGHFVGISGVQCGY